MDRFSWNILFNIALVFNMGYDIATSSMSLSDRVMVLDQGKVVEFDSPANLLEDSTSTFYAMVNAKR